LKDSETLASLGLSKGGKLYFRDLGTQVGWTTVSFVLVIDLVFIIICVMIKHFSYAINNHKMC